MPKLFFNSGFFDEERLFDMVMGWKNLFDAIAPDLVVFDHSPTALVASKCISAKRVIFGTCFYSPPRMRLMPTIQPWANPSLKRLQNSEKRVLQSINGALTSSVSPAWKIFRTFLIVTRISLLPSRSWIITKTGKKLDTGGRE
jgi:hypothetical protein